MGDVAGGRVSLYSPIMAISSSMIRSLPLAWASLVPSSLTRHRGAYAQEEEEAQRGGRGPGDHSISCTS